MLMIILLLLVVVVVVVGGVVVVTNVWPAPVAARTKTWVCGCSFDGIAGLNPVEGADLSLVSAVCC
jgi:Na+-transporting methylmalonyl-CoA/oxaloacetate decarboxylase gamma subunit